jgi:5-keto 4-deoxyuronate isomerase
MQRIALRDLSGQPHVDQPSCEMREMVMGVPVTKKINNVWSIHCGGSIAAYNFVRYSILTRIVNYQPTDRSLHRNRHVARLGN